MNCQCAISSPSKKTNQNIVLERETNNTEVISNNKNNIWPEAQSSHCLPQLILKGNDLCVLCQQDQKPIKFIFCEDISPIVFQLLFLQAMSSRF